MIRWALLAAAAAACTAAATTPDAPPAGAAPAASTWRARMLEVEGHVEHLERALLGMPQGDLVAAAAAARSAAAIVRDGYGKDEDKTVPGYARMARDAESWLLQVALEARSAHGELAADLFRAGRARHCASCHEAVERVHRAAR
jgi:hypothetical protein